jgi:hypothetical protein
MKFSVLQFYRRYAAYNPGMSALPKPIRTTRPPEPSTQKALCDRCGAEMFRMHAVWRCPSCGFKTDCCGW